MNSEINSHLNESAKRVQENWQSEIDSKFHSSLPPALLPVLNPLLKQIYSYGNGNFTATFFTGVNKIDFSIYRIEQVLTELRTLRKHVLKSLPPKLPPDSLDAIHTIFDQLIYRFSTESSHYQLGFKGWTSINSEPLASSNESKDSDFLSDPSRKQNILDAEFPDSETERSAREGVLREKSDFFAKASKVFAAAMGYEEIVSKIASLITDEFADWCILDCLNEMGDLKRMAVCHRSADFQELTEELRRDYGPKPDTRGVPSEVMRIKKPIYIPHVTDAHYQSTARSPRHEVILRALGSKSYLCLPLIARGNFVGVFTLVSSSKIYSPDDVIFAEELCSRAAIAIDNSIQFLRAQSAVAMRDNFVGIVAHDLKTPLQVILMSSHLLLQKKDDLDNARIQKLASTINEAGKRMNNLICDLLDLSRFESGHFIIHPKEENLSSIFLEIQRAFQPLTSNRNIEFTHSSAEAINFRCDRDRLIQAISNLVSNAIKLTPRFGTIRLEHRLKGNRLEISIQDSGCGVSKDVLGLIFDRFWQANDSDARKGTGIGLSIVKMMVEAHGGEVRAESEMGIGSRFTIDLPLIKERNSYGTGNA